MGVELHQCDNLKDADELVKLIKHYFPRSPFHPSVESIGKGNIVYFKCFQGQDCVGICGYYLKTPLLAETVKTVVFDGWRGKGLGKIISQAIEDECIRVGVKKVMTTIFHDNLPMIAIKLAQGYVIEGYHPDHEAPGFHEYSLGKKV